VRRLDHVGATVFDPSVEPVKQAIHLEVGETAAVAEPAGELGDAIPNGAEATHDLDPEPGQAVEIDRTGRGRADQLRRRDVSGADEIVNLVVALVEDAGDVHPPKDVVSPVGPGQPYLLPYRDRHLSPRPLNLVGQLNPGRRSAYDQHASLVERFG